MRELFYRIMGKNVSRLAENLLSAVDELSCSTKGTSDRLHPERAVLLREWLHHRVMDWKPSSNWDEDYDNAVKTLVNCCLSMYDSRDYKDDLDFCKSRGLLDDDVPVS